MERSKTKLRRERRARRNDENKITKENNKCTKVHGKASAPKQRHTHPHPAAGCSCSEHEGWERSVVARPTAYTGKNDSHSGSLAVT